MDKKPVAINETETLAAAAALSTDRRERGVTPRVVALCLMLTVLFGIIIPIIDVKLTNTFLGGGHLPAGGIAALLLVLLILNPLLRSIGKRFALSRNETLTVYISCLFSCLIPGHGSENYIIPNILAPFYYATQENRWLSFLEPHVKPWLTPALHADGTLNRALVESWYVGGSAVPWATWLVPLLAWGGFIFASYAMLGCMAVMLRAQWAGHEALRFPLLELPIALAQSADHDGGPSKEKGALLLKNPLMWIGFGIASLFGVMNGLNLYFPDVPRVPLTLDTGALFTEAPWNQIGWTPIFVIPFAVGVTCLLTTEIAFSLWFGFWFFKLQYVVAYALGFSPLAMPDAVGNTGAAKPFTQYQQIGAFLAIVVLTLWTGREHFSHIAKRAFGRARRTPEESHEVVSYPVAFWGFILGFAFMVGFSVMAGVQLHVALYLWTAYLVITIGLTRVIAEGGLLFVQPGWTPLGAGAQLFDAGAGTWMSANSVVPAAIFQNAMMVNTRAFLLPSFLQSFKLARDYGIRPRPLLALISIVILISLAMGLAMTVYLGYQYGGLSMFKWFTSIGAVEPAKNASALVDGVSGSSPRHAIWIAVGGALTYLLLLARNFLPWFPFHPIGLLPAMTFPMYVLWFSIFLGWLLKVIIMRFGGNDAYRNLTPVFLGLILGDVTQVLMWLAIDAFTGRTQHGLLF